jgi:uncharacterized protein (DUF488 family)
VEWFRIQVGSGNLHSRKIVQYMSNTVLTIGHSTHTIDAFLALLKQHDVTAVCDVRSSPYSQFNPQFNREELKVRLREEGIKYVFLGDELGARSDDPACYKDGKVQYNALAETEKFKSGIDRVRKGTEEYQIALMCAEKDPLECHRTILVSRELEKLECEISHILSNGDIEPHQESINRLQKLLKLDHGDFFMTDEEARDKAYKIQGESIAYEKKDETVETSENHRVAR